MITIPSYIYIELKREKKIYVEKYLIELTQNQAIASQSQRNYQVTSNKQKTNRHR